ncbi:MAG: hypothetical protein Q8L11_04700 [Candidatus Moranbacteria bacterium]|nr:hypothetical protein [bacterium]MDP1834196.1 hypothetical protein [Candidatus Moranbacteria bacterium]
MFEKDIKLESGEQGKPRKFESFFEAERRPEYKYFFHGTFGMSLESIEEKKVFEFNEEVPNLLISPSYALTFPQNELKKDKQNGSNEQMVKRSKHFPEEKRQEFLSRATLEEILILVIEPSEGYAAHSSNLGVPNKFSPDDALPEDLDQTIRTRVWASNQYWLRKNAEMSPPVMHVNKYRTPDGQWVDKDKRISIKGRIAADSVKFAIRRSTGIIDILKNIKTDMRNGELDNLDGRMAELVEILHDKDIALNRGSLDDKQIEELAANMVMGELEHYIVTEVRKLFLDIEGMKGKKLITVSGGVERDRGRINENVWKALYRLKKFKVGNAVLQRYLDLNCSRFESELARQSAEWAE